MQKEERVKITPSYPACSTEKENCMGSGCCKTSGHTCYKKNQHLALCNETCSTGKGRDAARRQGTPATKRISIWHCATRHAPLERVGMLQDVRAHLLQKESAFGIVQRDMLHW